MSTHTPITSLTLSAAQSTVTLSNIPTTYTDLILVAKFDRSAADTGSWFRINNDSGANYSTTEIRGNGSNATSGRDSNQTNGRYFRGLSHQTTDNFFIMQLMNYSNTNTNKTILTRGGVTTGTGSGTEANVNLWRSTSAITEINLITASGTYSAGSTFNLYGIANASLQSKASGGDIVTTDGTYWYHTFLSSGTFTPTQALTADTLVIAGGGSGGGGYYAGGGGAGGLLAHTAQSLVSGTGYTVTIGAGGAAQTTGTNGNTGSNSQFGSLTASVGGGGGGTAANNGISGGSGGGAGNNNNNTTLYTGGTATSGQGYAGGNAQAANTSSVRPGAGGGGAAAVGGDASGNGSTGQGGAGGVGSSTYSSWGSATATGQNVSGTYYFAGGGGGGSPTAGYGLGGSGGGGNGGTGDAARTVAPANAIANTGSGGGGSNWGAPISTSGAGGSGIVIVRYAV